MEKELNKEYLEAECLTVNNPVLQRALNTLRRLDTRYYVREVVEEVAVPATGWRVLRGPHTEMRTSYIIYRLRADGSVMTILHKDVDAGELQERCTTAEANAWISGKIFDLKPVDKARKEAERMAPAKGKTLRYEKK